MSSDQDAKLDVAVSQLVEEDGEPPLSMEITAAKHRFGRLNGALISVGGSPPLGPSPAPPSTRGARRSKASSSAPSAWPGPSPQTSAAPATTRRDLPPSLPPSLPGTGGSIAFVLAASVRAPLPGLAISNGLFPGLAGVVKTLAGEHGPAGIRINGQLPARIATDRVRQLDTLSGDPDEVRARLSQSIPLRRYGEPAEFGQAAAFLLYPAAS